MLEKWQFIGVLEVEYFCRGQNKNSGMKQWLESTGFHAKY